LQQSHRLHFFITGVTMTRSEIIFSALALIASGLVSGVASAKTCEVAIEGTDAMKFSTDRIPIAADCTDVKLTLKHAGKLPVTAMGHNWVLTETAVFQPVATAGTAAGAAAGYVPKSDPRIIANTKLIGGGETTTVSFPTSKLKKGGDYTFFCSFPGHWTLMKGKLAFG
jgi:azurin